MLAALRFLDPVRAKGTLLQFVANCKFLKSDIVLVSLVASLELFASLPPMVIHSAVETELKITNWTFEDGITLLFKEEGEVAVWVRTPGDILLQFHRIFDCKLLVLFKLFL